MILFLHLCNCFVTWFTLELSFPVLNYTNLLLMFCANTDKTGIVCFNVVVVLDTTLVCLFLIEYGKLHTDSCF